MTVFDTFIGPTILVGLFLALLAWLAIWLTLNYVRRLKAETAGAQVPLRLLAQQRDAIDAVITEMAEHPSIVLSQGTQDALFAAHAAASVLGGGKIRR